MILGREKFLFFSSCKQQCTEKSYITKFLQGAFNTYCLSWWILQVTFRVGAIVLRLMLIVIEMNQLLCLVCCLWGEGGWKENFWYFAFVRVNYFSNSNMQTISGLQRLSPIKWFCAKCYFLWMKVFHLLWNKYWLSSQSSNGLI